MDDAPLYTQELAALAAQRATAVATALINLVRFKDDDSAKSLRLEEVPEELAAALKEVLEIAVDGADPETAENMTQLMGACARFLDGHQGWGP